MLSRRRFVAFVNTLPLASLAACRRAEPGPSKEAGPAARQPVTLKSWIIDPTSVVYPAFEAVDRRIFEKYPWLRVEHEARPPGDYIDAVVTRAAAGQMPDMIYAQGTQIQAFIRQGLVRALDPYLARAKEFDIADFPPVAMKLYTGPDGKIYGIPYDHGPLLIWYNRDIFDKEGVPYPTPSWTFDDWLAAAKRLTRPADGQWGAVSFIPGGGWTMHGSYMLPFGGSFLNEQETETQIDSRESIQALEWWVAARMSHRVIPMDADLQGVTGGQYGLFRAGRAGMFAGGPWNTRELVSDKVQFRFDIADWPRGPRGRWSASMGSAYPMTRDTRYPDECWLYLSELLGKSDDSLFGEFLRTGLGIPVRNSFAPRWEKSPFAPPSAAIVAPAQKNYAVIGIPISPVKPDLDRIVNREFGLIWRGEKSVADACRTIKQEIAPLLEQNRR